MHPWVKLVMKEGDKEYPELGEKHYGTVTEVHQAIPPDRIDIEETTPGWVGDVCEPLRGAPGSSNPA